MKLFKRYNAFIVIKITSRKVLIALMLIICALSFTISHYLLPLPKEKTPSFIGTVVIDPGHGGIDGGTHDHQGLLEKHINLEVSLLIRKELEEKGVRVVMTRHEDVSLDSKSKLKASRHRKDLDARRMIINGSNADLFVSVHVNANPRLPGQRGTYIFYSKKQEKSKGLALDLAKSVDDIVNKNYLENENLYPQVLKNSSYYILNTASIPGVIFEIAFITNPQDKQLLQDETYKRMVALAVSQGVVKCLLEEKKK
jgi:N-acetylmuramoyl-L-alanine amidase